MKKNMSLYDYYAFVNSEDVIIFYKGPVTPTILSEISTDIRGKFKADPKAGRKIFKIYMELAQNILYYSAEKIRFSEREDSVGLLLITEAEEGYVFSCGNIVDREYVPELSEGCKLINSLDKEGLRELEGKKLSGPQGKLSKGAGIGLIKVALTSGNPLKLDIKEIDSKHSFYSLSVIINKKGL